MKQSIFTILSNEALTDSVYKMVLSGDTSHITNCGQFVNIQLEGMFLRRPISVCDYDEETLTIVYKVVGKGTEAIFLQTPSYKSSCQIFVAHGRARIECTSHFFRWWLQADILL